MLTFFTYTVIEEWSKLAILYMIILLLPTLTIQRELDFKHELNNMRVVASNLQRAGIKAIVPTPYPELSTSHLLVMDFIEGFKVRKLEHCCLLVMCIKVTDLDALDRHKIDRTALLLRICQAYAHQIYVDGVFNADPHPGNILINVSNGIVQPVLLDFGLTKASICDAICLNSFSRPSPLKCAGLLLE